MREGKVEDMARRQIRLWGKGSLRGLGYSPSPLMGCWDRKAKGKKADKQTDLKDTSIKQWDSSKLVESIGKQTDIMGGKEKSGT